MNILHISTFDNFGGAARSAYRVHKGMLGLGFDSSMLVLRKSSDDTSIREFAPSKNLLLRAYQRIRRAIHRRQYHSYADTRRDPFQPFSDDRTAHWVDLGEFVPQPDIVNLYWIGGFLDYRHFFGSVPADIPIVWRLSDMNAFTGGCHYAWDCEKWRDGCGACPELGSRDENDLSRGVWKRKYIAYQGHRINIVAPSRWLAREVKRSSLLGDQPVTVIPNGLDTSRFAPHNQKEARIAMGLSQDGLFVLSGANYLQDGRKGFRYLVDAIQRLSSEKRITLLMLGEGTSAALDRLSIRHQRLGYIDDDEILALAYAAADVCVIPSIYENLPNMAVEAMACGTPVVAFRTGGFPDVVRHEETGLLAVWKDTSSLAAQIGRLLDNPGERQRMGWAARKLVEQEHTLEAQAQRFAVLYQKFLTDCLRSGRRYHES